MKRVLLSITFISAVFFPNINFGQAPAIVTQPTNQIVCSGVSVSFSVAATGAGLTYQWRKGTIDLTDGGNISGSNTATLTINPVSVADASSDFNVIVSGAIAPNDTSNDAVLDVNTAPNITTQPTNQTICSGDTAKLSVIATGFDLTYQWRNGTTNLVTGGNVLDATSATLLIYPVTAADTGSDYNVIVTGGCPPNAISVNASILVNPASAIVSQPSNQIVCLGGSATFTVGATGTGLTYQWRKGNVNLVNGLTVSGVNTASLVINPVTVLDTASDYNVIVSGGCGKDTSINVFLRFNNIKINGQPGNETVCAGSPASFSVSTTGIILSYQWMKGNTILTNGGNISGANTATLTINPTAISDTSSYYHVIVIGSCALIDTSKNVYLKINTAPTITSQPSSQAMCSSSVSFSVGASGTGLTYQWMNGNTVLANGGNISGATTATLTIDPANISDTSSLYHVVITGACAPSVTSTNVYLTPTIEPHISAEPISQTICPGSPVSFSVNVTGSGLTYQWMNGSTVLANGGNISGATTATLTINPANISDTSSFYHVLITGSCASAETSSNVYLKFNTAPTITVQPSSQTICSGSPVSFSVGANGTGFTYQWMNGSTVLANGGNISGATTATLTINPANISDTSSFYHVVITGACALSATSANVYLKLNTTPTITVQSASQTVCLGNPVSFSVEANGIGLTYQWMKGGTVLTNGGAIAGATTATLTINPTSISDTSSFYHAVITGTCALSVTSANVYLHINLLPVVTASANIDTVCAGSSVILTGGGAVSYSWTNGVTNSISYTPTSTSIYTVTGTDGNGCSNTATVTVNVKNLPADMPTSNSPVCIGSAINLNTTSVAGVSYNWAGPNGFTSTNQNPSISSATGLNAGTYSLTVSNGACTSMASVAVTVSNCGGTDLSVVKTVNNAYPLIGNDVVFTITAHNNGPKNASGVVIGDTLQSGYSYISSTATKGNYSPATGIWTIDTLANGATAVLTVTVKINASGSYSNTANIHGGAPDTNQVNNSSTIETFPTNFFIPEGFSPNGDGINDLFVIRGIDNYPHNAFNVFNRWGDKVYSADAYQSNWDGKATMGVRVGGDELPVGTYFYTLDLGDGSKAYKGSIYLNK